MKLWNSWDEDERASAVRIAGLVVAALTIFILIATVSYLFHWQEDMSMPEVYGNAAGKLGHLTGRLLVCELFGLGSFALLIILTAVSVRLLTQKWHVSLIKTALIAIFGAFITSLLLAYLSKLFGWTEMFAGGLGGRCGAFAVNWSDIQFGIPVTGIFIFLLILAILFFSSKPFTRWFSSLGNLTPEQKEAKEAARIAKKEAKAEARRLAEEEKLRKKEEKQRAREDRKNGKKTDEAPEESVEPMEISVEDPGQIEAGPVISDDIDIAEAAGVEAAADAEASVPAVAGSVADDVAVAEAAAAVAAKGGFEIVEDTGLDAEPEKELEPIDNRMDPPEGLPKYKFPSLDLLESHAGNRREVSNEELIRNNNKIRAALANYKIQINDVKAIVGPTVTLYKVYPAPGVKIADIKKLQEDIALSLNAKGVRVVTLSDSVGIEVANDYSSIVPLKALLNDEAFRESKADLPIAIGYTITQKVKVFDLADAPHLLVAGATKQGKSVGLNVIVSSLLYAKHPSELRFVFIDPKMVEFSSYANLLKHYLAVLPDAVSEEDEKAAAIVKKPKDAEKILRSLCTEMDDRYELLSKAGVNNLKSYNNKFKERRLRPDHGHRFLPYLVVVVDEYADLTMTTGASSDSRAAARSITNSIIRLAQKGRAAGLHVILATQRPSVDVISGIIKSNFPMRIAFRVASRMDSMTILDNPGAEKLIGKGDMLFSAGIDSERIQCGYISSEEIDKITEFIGSQEGYGRCYNTPYYLPSPAEPEAEGGGSGNGMVDMSKLDDRFEEAAKMVVLSQRGSTSDLQRKLGMGYAKAGRVMDQLESAGIVGPQEGSKPRQVLVQDLNSLQEILDAFMK